MSNQQMTPLRGLGVELTDDIVDRFRWEPFWDAPLELSEPTGRQGNPPPAAGVANQPGLPRKSEEITRAEAFYRVTSCDVKTNGARIEVTFPGVQLGVFTGALQYSVFKGSNLIQQDLVASTPKPWVAYKYTAGLKGLSTTAGTRVAWRDIANNWQDYRFGGAANEQEVPLATTGRVVIAERGAAGSIAAFSPPHTFFWAREIAINLGYNFYKKENDGTFSFGDAAGREGTRVGEPRQLRPLQRSPRFDAAHDGVPVPDARGGAGHLRRRHGVHARRPLQAAARLPGDESSLPHGSGPASGAGWQPRCRHSRPESR